MSGHLTNALNTLSRIATQVGNVVGSVVNQQLENLENRINTVTIKDTNNTVVLTKGVNISLQKEIEAGLETVSIGLAWDEIPGATSFDADSIAVMLDANGKLISNGVVYYGLASTGGAPFKSTDGSISHSGDNLTGRGSGDDETLTVALKSVPASVEKINFIINIHEAASRGQNFGQVPSCKARIYNTVSGDVLGKYDLVEDFSAATAVEVCQLYRYEGSWKFKALGNSLTGNLQEIVAKYK